MRTTIQSALLAVVFLAAFAAAGAGQDVKMKKEFKRGNAPVNGLKIYYEIHGVADAGNPWKTLKTHPRSDAGGRSISIEREGVWG
jgi:hypothetical protein